MKKINRKHEIILFFNLTVLLVLLNCESIDPLSPGPQPIELEPTEFQPKLNVFAVLRPDSLDGLPLSFVHLEKAYPLDDQSDSSDIADALVQIVKTGVTSSADTSLFIYSNLGIFSSCDYRNAGFFPEPGDYELICRKEGYPTLFGRTTLPNVPLIRDGSLQKRENELVFTILRDENAGMYEVTLTNGVWYARERVLCHESGDVEVSIALDDAPHGEYMLLIHAFDLHLSEYLTANLSIKPNIYQKDFSTVENGYGCFGALNMLEMLITL